MWEERLLFSLCGQLPLDASMMQDCLLYEVFGRFCAHPFYMVMCQRHQHICQGAFCYGKHSNQCGSHLLSNHCRDNDHQAFGQILVGWWWSGNDHSGTKGLLRNMLHLREDQ